MSSARAGVRLTGRCGLRRGCRMADVALLGADIHDGTALHRNMALWRCGADLRIVPPGDLPDGCRRRDLGGGILLPGFVDLQVNGGGGVMFNDAPSLATLRVIARAHHGLGTRAFLPTLISDTPAQTRAAVAAVEQAMAAGVPGILGLHLEGPHLAPARKGAHAARLIRPMEEPDLRFLCEAAARLPNLMVTLAPEAVTGAQISQLATAGVIVSVGHSAADHGQARAAFDAGARCVTHLFNAMEPLLSRAPGLIGATLADERVSCGLIADGFHVDPVVMEIALAAKRGPGQIFLVSDAMATAASAIPGFDLNGRRVRRMGGRLVLEDGTLAGADLDMAGALRVLVGRVGESPARAIRRATGIPAAVLRDDMGQGRLQAGNVIHLCADLHLRAGSGDLWQG